MGVERYCRPMPRAVLLGGTGAIGYASALRLAASGWSVEVTCRDLAGAPPALADAGVEVRVADRTDVSGLRRALGAGADLLVDCACFTGAQARALAPFLGAVGHTVLISSKAVYVDGSGRHANGDEPARFVGPIREDQPTLAPGDAPSDTPAGYGANKVAAEQVLLDTGAPVTVVRPSKIHGPYARRPREWVFVRRVLDRRRVVLLARTGAGVDHTTAAANVAALIDAVAQRPGRRVLNCADPDAPSARAIARAVAAHLGHDWSEVLLPDNAELGLGGHPWDTLPPIVLDTAAAADLGYAPVGDFAATVADEVRWLSSAAGGRGAPPGPFDRAFFAPYFDYVREDRWLAEHPVAGCS